METRSQVQITSVAESSHTPHTRERGAALLVFVCRRRVLLLLRPQRLLRLLRLRGLLPLRGTLPPLCSRLLVHVHGLLVRVHGLLEARLLVRRDEAEDAPELPAVGMGCQGC